jgi:hypothetical protein
VGIIGEGDLINREEIGTEIHHPSWIEAVTPALGPRRIAGERTALIALAENVTWVAEVVDEMIPA